jgi:hypothetical protein
MQEFVHIDLEEAKKLGKARREVHKNHGSQRLYADPTTEDVVGISGEIAFAAFSGLQANLDILENGDGLVDFRFTYGGKELTIDVKGSRNPIHLLLKEKKAKKAADILVLASVDGDEVWFIGWEHKSLMLLSPVRDFGGYGIPAHYRHYAQLRPMWQLLDLIEQGRQQGQLGQKERQDA